MQNNTPQHTSHDSLGTLASQLGETLYRRYGVMIPASEVVEMLADSVRAGMAAAPDAAPARSRAPATVQDLVRIARDERLVFRAVSCEGLTRLESSHPGRAETPEVLGTFAGSFGDQLSLLTGTGLPENVRFSTVVTLTDGSRALVQVEHLRREAQDGAYVLSQYTVSAMPAKAPALSLDDLGITQVRRWRDSTTRAGLNLVLGTGVRTTFRATAAELEGQGAKAVWIHAMSPQAELSLLKADVLVFERAIREPDAAYAVMRAAEHAVVLATCGLPEAAQAVEFLVRCSGRLGLVRDVLNAILRQRLFEGHTYTDGAPSAPVLTSEFIGLLDRSSVEAVLDDELTVRLMVIDVAEKVRAGLISEPVAQQAFADELDTYL
jgi:hypothetical protein